MKQLKRIQPGPQVLDKFDFNSDDWNKLTSSDKKEIWVELVKMQGKVCAYCERKIDLFKAGDKHIEHFKRKGIHKSLTFDWGNLFGSCGERNRCGFYKDKQSYMEANLLKADEANPDDYFIFSSTGELSIKSNLPAQLKIVASETIRVFNLNPISGGVKSERRSSLQKSLASIKQYVKIAEDLINAGEDIVSTRQMVRDDYYNLIHNREFSTAHKHVFESFLL